jgi:ACR3 family arsenite efflux pump ArsB
LHALNSGHDDKCVGYLHATAELADAGVSTAGVRSKSWGESSQPVIGPLVEMPVMIALVNVSLRLQTRWSGCAAAQTPGNA